MHKWHVPAEELTTAGVLIHGGSFYPDQGPANAFDGNVSWYSGVSSPDTYIGRDFGAAKTISRIEVYGTSSFSFFGKVQYSDDGSRFTDAGLVVNVAPYDYTWHSFPVPYVGPHRYWIIRDLQDDAYFQIDDVRLFGPCEACLLDDMTRKGTVVSGGNSYPGQGPENAFDSHDSWYSGTSAAGTYIGRDFGATEPQAVRRMDFFGTASYSFYGKVQYSDDGATFVDTGVIVSVPASDVTNWHTYSIPQLGSHRFWVIRDLQDDAYHQIQKIRIYACALCALDNVTQLGSVVFGGSAYPGQGPENVFDGHDDTWYSGVSSASTYIGRDFGLGGARTVVRMDVSGTASFSFYGRIQYSDDGTTFTDTGITVDVASGDSTLRSYSIPDVGPHRFWIVRDLQDDAYLQINDIHLYALAELTRLGSVASGGSWYISQTPANAFDGLDGSWYSGSSSPGTFVGRDFGASSPQVVRRIAVHGTSWYTFYGTVQYSDDGVTFTDANLVINVDRYDSAWRFYNLPDWGPHRIWIIRDLQDDAYLQINEIRMYPSIGASATTGMEAPLPPPPVPPPASSSCAGAGVFPSAMTWTAAGGTGEFDVNYPAPCSWTASSDSSWLLPLTTAATGSQKLQYAVGRNDAASSRTGVLRINGGGIVASFTITQSGSDGSAGSGGGTCFNGVFPSAASFVGDGGNGSITVSAPDGCTWTASTSVSWVTLASGSGAGSVILGYTVAPNPSATVRTATVTIHGATFLITQDVAGTTGGGGSGGGGSGGSGGGAGGGGGGGGGGGSTTTISRMVSSTGQTGAVVVQASSATPEADVPWLTATGDASLGTMNYTAAPAPAGTARTGHIIVGATTLTVFQPGSIFDNATGWWCDPPPPVCDPESADCSYEYDYDESCIGGDDSLPLRPAHVHVMTVDTVTNRISVWLRGDAQGPLVLRLDGPGVPAVVLASRWVDRGIESFTFDPYLADVRAGRYTRITADWEVDSWGPNVNNCYPAPEPGDPCDERPLFQLASPLPRLTLVTSDIEHDQIGIQLVGNGEGPVEITLEGDSSSRSWSPGSRGEGAWTFSFSPTELAEGQYTRLTVKWNVPSDYASLLETGVGVSFRVLGWVHHTQYNTPYESACSPGFGLGFFETKLRACDFAGAFVMRPMFVSKAYTNGTGVSDVDEHPQYGLLKAETRCQGWTDAFYKTSFPITGAANQPIDNLSVAVNDIAQYLKFSSRDRILIVGLGSTVGTVKRVLDRCGDGCLDDPDHHIDNYNPTPACTKVGDLPGGTNDGWFFTIRLR